MDKFSKFFIILFISISFILFSYTLYRDFIFWERSSSIYYYKFYLTALAIFLFSLISFFISKVIKIYIFIIFFSVVFSLYAYEIYLGSFDGMTDKIKNYKEKTGKNFDLRDRKEVFEELNKNNEKVVVPIPPQVHSKNIMGEELSSSLTSSNKNLFPLSGISNSLTLDCNENGYYTKYISDRHGFNNKNSEWDKKNIDYLLVGDSFTHGSCVNPENNIASNLIKLKNNKNGVINLGYKGNDTLIEYATLKEYLPYIKAKYILWFYFEGNDLDGLTKELKDKTLIKYLNDNDFSQNLFFRQEEIDRKNIKIMEIEAKHFSRTQVLEKEPRFLYLIKLIKLYNLRKILFSPYNFLQEQNGESIDSFEFVLGEANKLALKHESQLYFVYLPSYLRYKQLNYDNHYSKILRIVKGLKIPIIDIHKSLFNKHNSPLSLFPFKQRGHYNVEGYNLVSKTIFNEIKKKNLTKN
tara:strand:- start:2132 stop:3529 length:1398 start_codon:yes stop_codon:yes gene_type:complete